MALAYILCYLFAIWSQLQKMEQNPKGVSADSSMLPKNTGNQVQLEYSIIRLANYSVTTSFIYKYDRKKILRDFRVYVRYSSHFVI